MKNWSRESRPQCQNPTTVIHIQERFQKSDSWKQLLVVGGGGNEGTDCTKMSACWAETFVKTGCMWNFEEWEELWKQGSLISDESLLI